MAGLPYCYTSEALGLGVSNLENQARGLSSSARAANASFVEDAALYMVAEIVPFHRRRAASVTQDRAALYFRSSVNVRRCYGAHDTRRFDPRSVCRFGFRSAVSHPDLSGCP